MPDLFSCLRGFVVFMQVISLGLGVPIWSSDSPADNGTPHGLQVKRQTAYTNWTVTQFSECSVSCGGGFKTRSVRCLTKDGIISQNCDAENRPASYEFCNQIDCTTNSPNPGLIPAPGIYNFDISDGSRAILQFVNQGSGNYSVLLNILEADGTWTTVNQIVAIEGTQTPRVTVSGANNNIRIQQINGNTEALLTVDGVGILSLNTAGRINVTSSQSILYQKGEVFIANGEILAENIASLNFYDGLRLYRFDADILDPLDGPGVLYYNLAKSQALYSTDISLNTNLDQVVHAFRSQLFITDPNSQGVIATTTSPEIESTEQLTTPSTPQPTPQPPASTIRPATSTVRPTAASTGDPEVTDELDKCKSKSPKMATRSSTRAAKSTRESKHTMHKSRRGIHSQRKCHSSDQTKKHHSMKKGQRMKTE